LQIAEVATPPTGNTHDGGPCCGFCADGNGRWRFTPGCHPEKPVTFDRGSKSGGSRSGSKVARAACPPKPPAKAGSRPWFARTMAGCPCHLARAAGRGSDEPQTWARCPCHAARASDPGEAGHSACPGSFQRGALPGGRAAICHLLNDKTSGKPPRDLGHLMDEITGAPASARGPGRLGRPTTCRWARGPRFAAFFLARAFLGAKHRRAFNRFTGSSRA